MAGNYLGAIRYGDRGVPGVPGIPEYFQHRCGCSGKGGNVVILRSSGGTSWVGLGGRRTQHSIIHGRRPYSGSQPHLGPDNTYVGGKDVQ